MPSAERRAEGALLLVTLAWGLTFPVIKGVMAETSPFPFLALRFPLALLFLWPFIRRGRITRAALVPGLWLSLFMALSFYTQTFALTLTTPTRCAFITALSVVLVPLLYPAFTRRLPRPGPAAGAVVAVAGLYLMTAPGGAGLNRGDVLTLGCAVAYALYIVYLEVASRRHRYEDLILIQFLPLSVIFLPGAILAGGHVAWGKDLAIGLLVTGPILALTVFLQNRYQKDTTATRAAVIFAGEPVFAAMFSYLLLGETLSAGQWGGAGLILVGILLAIRGTETSS
jgi:drug/metabolite transporter (DMT)-like permease